MFYRPVLCRHTLHLFFRFPPFVGSPGQENPRPLMLLMPRCPAHFVQDPTSLAYDTNDDIAAKLAKLLRYQSHPGLALFSYQ